LGVTEFGYFSLWFSVSLRLRSFMHPQLYQCRRVEQQVLFQSFATRLFCDTASSGLVHIDQLATIISGVQSILRACTGILLACGASAPPNYVLNRTVGDMLRSNQSISALGRLARR
jgi:hypothetical protein